MTGYHDDDEDEGAAAADDDGHLYCAGNPSHTRMLRIDYNYIMVKITFTSPLSRRKSSAVQTKQDRLLEHSRLESIN